MLTWLVLPALLLTTLAGFILAPLLTGLVLLAALVCGTVEMVNVSATKNEPMVEIEI